MRLKTFHAATIEEAMAEVRAALGEQAVIVSTVRGRRGRGVQVTAAKEADLPGAIEPAPMSAPPAEADPIATLLNYHRLPAPVAASLVRSAASFEESEPALKLGAALDVGFGFAPLPAANAKPLMLIGAPGAGKTVTAAKLAARAALAGATVALISTDTVRAGGVDQLRAFATVLGCPFEVAATPEALAAACAKLRGGEGDTGLIIVDSPGVNPFNVDEVEDLRAFTAAVAVEPVLVVAAGGDAEEAAETARVFAGFGVKRFVSTRLDAARRLGSLLATAEAGRFAFAEASLTPFIAQGLTTLNPLSFARLLVQSQDDGIAATAPLSQIGSQCP